VKRRFPHYQHSFPFMINNIFAYIRNDICSFPCLSVYPSEYEIISILSLIIHLLVFTWNYSCSLPWLIACFFAYDSLPFSHYPSFHLYVKLFLFLYSTTHEFLSSLKELSPPLSLIAHTFTCTWKHPSLPQFIDTSIYTWRYLHSFPGLSTYLSESECPT
jgi:hypothetical protein